MKLFPFIVLVFCSFSPSFSQDKTDKFLAGGRFNVSIGTGFGLFGVTNNQLGDKESGALTGNLNLNADYGIMPSLTGGITLYRNGFATNKDSNEAAKIVGLGIYLHYNFSRRPKATWYLKGALGGNTLTYSNFNNNGKISGSGSYSCLGLGFRKYFGENFGLFSEFNATGYNYDKFTILSGTSKDQTFKTRSGNDFGLAMAGVEFKIGLVYAIGKNTD